MGYVENHVGHHLMQLDLKLFFSNIAVNHCTKHLI